MARDPGGLGFWLEVVSVQNLYNLTRALSRTAVLEYCEANDIAFIPWYPIATGQLAHPGGPLDAAARAHGATPAQLALAWLLRRSPVMVPIPGTSKVDHLEENMRAAEVALTDAEFKQLSTLG